MRPGYMSAVRELPGNADIVHDKFPISKYLNESVDQVRSKEHKRLLWQADTPLSGTQYVWLKGLRDKRCAQAVAFRHLYQANLQTSWAWALKESFAAFWNYRYPKAAQNFFNAWSTRAMRSRIEPIKTVTKMLRRRSEGLFSCTKYRITDAAPKGFNSSIQAITTNARGFRSFANYRIRMLSSAASSTSGRTMPDHTEMREERKSEKTPLWRFLKPVMGPSACGAAPTRCRKFFDTAGRPAVFQDGACPARRRRFQLGPQVRRPIGR